MTPSRFSRVALTAFAIGLALAFIVGTVVTDWPAAWRSRSWWQHVTQLASDDMEGRFTGSSGYQRAADYVAARFTEYGLEPGGTAGFFQAVPLTGQRVRLEASQLALVDEGAAQPLDPQHDCVLQANRIPQLPEVDAPLVFIGYGLHVPAAGYDDFAGGSLRGAILVAFGNGSPSSLPSNQAAHARASETWGALERVGARGMITLANPKSMDVPWWRQVLLAAQEGMYLSDPALRDAREPTLSAACNPDNAEKLFARSPHRFAELLALADRAEPLPRFVLNRSLRARVEVETRALSSPNVVAVLPGSDPVLRREYVVLSAHLDHLGIGQAIRGDRIYNGAMDNAAGVASLLEVARQLSAEPTRPRRSVIFLAVTAEERGLLGSRYFAEHPTVPRSGLVANVNVDMFLPIWPMTSVLVHGVGESTLGADASSVASQQGYQLADDPDPGRNSFIRSDQYSFIRAGVPALSLKLGYRRDSDDARRQKAWLTQHYHAPSDDLEQNVDFDTARRFNAYLSALVEHIANGPARPRWLPSSVFATCPETEGSSHATPQHRC